MRIVQDGEEVNPDGQRTQLQVCNLQYSAVRYYPYYNVEMCQRLWPLVAKIASFYQSITHECILLEVRARADD